MTAISDTTEYALSGEQIEDIVQHALIALRWTAITWDDPAYPDGVELDGSKFSEAEWSEAALKEVRETVHGFLSIIEETDEGILDGLDTEQVGHDLVLTAQHHGTGFWDRGLGDRGRRLTEIAHTFTLEVTVGDDGQLELY